MKRLKILVVACIVTAILGPAFADDPDDPVWGVYASGVGEKLRPGMDPCWITYTVGLLDNSKIQANVANGTMGAILIGVSWYEATAAQRRFSRYFDDQPDGTFKLTPCEFRPPDIGDNWFAPGLGKMDISQSGDRITGTLTGVNPNDHWGMLLPTGMEEV